ncbi:MAG: hypothetical protein CO119_04435 [Flavobacteriales bacterium CG_4_9_14_3_um_filter_40_17]|nr:MAG: hypothetical protein CO119_04435 [Flavobacteriales bacterium CG_4_9_14_3_um_filter_40_17]
MEQDIINPKLRSLMWAAVPIGWLWDNLNKMSASLVFLTKTYLQWQIGSTKTKSKLKPCKVQVLIGKIFMQCFFPKVFMSSCAMVNLPKTSKAKRLI